MKCRSLSPQSAEAQNRARAVPAVLESSGRRFPEVGAFPLGSASLQSICTGQAWQRGSRDSDKKRVAGESGLPQDLGCTQSLAVLGTILQGRLLTSEIGPSFHGNDPGPALEVSVHKLFCSAARPRNSAYSSEKKTGFQNSHTHTHACIGSCCGLAVFWRLARAQPTTAPINAPATEDNMADLRKGSLVRSCAAHLEKL